MEVRRHIINARGGQQFLQHTELVSIYGAASWGEVDDLYTSVSNEAARLARVLERNSTVLIRTGIANRLVEHAGSLYQRSGAEEIGADSRFHVCVGESDGGTSILNRNPEIIELFYRNPKYGLPHAIGRRALVGPNEIEFMPLQPKFDDEDIRIAAGLLTDLLDGSFPHVSPSGLTHLIVHGSLDPATQERYTQKYFELCSMNSLFQSGETTH